MSREFFSDVHWLLDEKGKNRIKYLINWFDPCYVDGYGRKLDVVECLTMGNTGLPIVDACVRCQNTCGFLHFTGRILIAQFLVHFLGVNWTFGQKYFARTSVDYDWSLNDCNWHWVACLAMFAPHSLDLHIDLVAESRKLDADASFIKYWVPELKNVNSEIIHTWVEKGYREAKKKNIAYRKPLVDLKLARQRVLTLYEEVRTEIMEHSMSM